MAVQVAKRARSWRQDPEGRRTRILIAAATAFSKRGYQRTRMADVARAARVAEGTVFALVGSKRELLVAVGERYGHGMAAAAFGPDGAAAVHVRDIPGVVRRIFRYVERTDGSLAAFLLAADPNEGATAQAANRAQMLRAIEAVVRHGIRRGEISRRDPLVAAELQFGIVESALRDCFLRHGGRHRARYEREAARCLDAYLRA